MKQLESGNDGSARDTDSSRLSVAYIYCRTWCGFKSAFLVDDFNALPNDEIETAIRAFGRDWLKRNRKRVAKLIAERKQDIEEQLAKRKRMFTQRVHRPVGGRAKAKRELERADATYKRLTTMPRPDDFATIAGLAGWARLAEFPDKLSPSPRMYLGTVPSLNAEGTVATLNSAQWPGVAADALGDGEFAGESAMLRPRFDSVAETDLSEAERAIAYSAIAALAREPSKRDRKELRLRHRIALGAAPVLQQFQTVPATLDQVKQTIRDILAQHPPIAERVARDPTAHFAARWWPRGGGVPVSALPHMVESRLNQRGLRSDQFDIDTAIDELRKNGEIERIESGPDTAFLDSSGVERRNPVLRICSTNNAGQRQSPPDSSVNTPKPKRRKQRAVPKEIEMLGMATKLSKLIRDEEMETRGRGISDLLKEAGVNWTSFQKSEHFEEVRKDWERVDEARKTAGAFLEETRKGVSVNTSATRTTPVQCPSCKAVDDSAPPHTYRCPDCEQDDERCMECHREAAHNDVRPSM